MQRIQAAVLRRRGGPMKAESLDDGRPAGRRGAGAHHRQRHLPHRHPLCRRLVRSSRMGPLILGHEGAGIVERVGTEGEGRPAR
ncbi:MAG: hypothetical protein MZU97_07695 [Bacillus subtilis]|nr:hypothetical protein [Bacillus subtilis]